jgi:hypothetical protein
MPIGLFFPSSPVTYFAESSDKTSNFAHMAVQKTAPVSFQVIVFEGALDVDSNKLYTGIPANKVTNIYEGVRDGDAFVVSLANAGINNQPRAWHTVAMVAIFNPGTVPDNVIQVDSTAIHIVSQTAPRATPPSVQIPLSFW